MEALHPTSRQLMAHHLWFAFFWILSLLSFGGSCAALVRLAAQDARYSNVLLIPLMAGFMVYVQRRRVFASLRYCPSKSAPLLFLGIALYYLAQKQFPTLNSNDRLSVIVLAMVLVWTAGFVLCYGAQAYRAAVFPLSFLLLMIPIPTVALDNTVLALQEGSAITTYALFKLFHVPVLWQQHFNFVLPGVEIQIAKECSGIRSSLSLFITSILAGYLFLQSTWRRVVFSLFTIPVVIFKNAVRIVTLSCLGVYVDPGFLHGRLHHYGGLPFSLVSLAILVPLLFALQKGETQSPTVDRSEECGSRQDPTPLSPRTEAV
jgi:exosortase